MNITNVELTQASMEIFGSLVCLVLMIVIAFNKNTKNCMQKFKWMFLTLSIVLAFDAAAYIYRGNIDLTSIIMNRASNVIVFIANLLLEVLLIDYIYANIKERGFEPGIAIKRLVQGCVIAGILIVVISQFTDWMYYFDEQNYYHRNFLWYAYTGLSFLGVVACAAMVLLHRKKLGMATIVSTLLVALFPIIAIIIQTFIYGISIINIGFAIAVVFMMITYVIDWNKAEIQDADLENTMRKSLEMILLFVMMVLVMSSAIISCIVSIERLAEEKAEENGRIIANMVNDRVLNEFLKPIAVSKAMAVNSSVHGYIKGIDEGDEAAEKELLSFLKSVKEGFGYQVVFTTCEKSRGYYTSEGHLKHLDPDSDGHDVWYRDFVGSGKEVELNVDTDESDNYQLSIFVNYRVKDENDTLLGVSGVAVNMDKLQEVIREEEEKYNIKVNLVDPTGLIMVDSDGSRIEKDRVNFLFLEKVSSEEFYLEHEGDSNVLAKYINDLGWYLIVCDKEPGNINVLALSWPSIAIFVGGLCVMGVIFLIIEIRARRATKALLERRKIALTDELTGLYNRRAYEEDSEKLINSDNLKAMTIVMLDVNGLKAVNDSLGHVAGDELIIGAANCMTNTMSSLGAIYRIGGDEFAAILKCDRARAQEAMDTFDHVVSGWKGNFAKELTVSKGFVTVAENPGKSLEELKEMADKLMYEDKDEYYRRTGKKRRQ